MHRTDPVIRQALESLAVGNKLDPVAVVEAARDKTSPLHDCFTWDNSEAAHQFRLIEARKLIQVHVEMLPGSSDSSPVWVSLTTDRNAGGGYRPLVSILSNADQRAMLLSDALRDLEYFRKKYGMLKELAAVFAAAKKVKKKA
jgi:hypothetical protein